VFIYTTLGGYNYVTLANKHGHGLH